MPSNRTRARFIVDITTIDSMVSSELSFTEELNNKAILLLHDGKYEEAIQILACALHATKRHMDDDSKGQEQEEKMRLDLDKLLVIQSPVVACEEDLVQHEQQGLTAYVCNRAIVIPHCSNLKSAYESSILCGTIVIFNLALSYHLAAKGSPKRKVYLHKAAKLYELAYNLHIEHNMKSVIFSMATINNLGLVHEALRHTESSRRCFQHVLSTMMCLIDCGDYVLSEHEAFVHNASIFVMRTNAAAAAA
jgi:hypothetical protein